MRIWIATLVLAATTACATEFDLRERSPARIDHSFRTVAEITSCLAARWDKRHGTMTGIAHQDGVTLTLVYQPGAQPYPAATIDVDGINQPQRIVRTRLMSGIRNRRIKGDLAACL